VRGRRLVVGRAADRLLRDRHRTVAGARREKERRTGGVVAKGGERDARQVLANGGLFTLAALGSLLAPSPLWEAAGAGAIAAATADTWATRSAPSPGGRRG
jgi:hypothetical protein